MAICILCEERVLAKRSKLKTCSACRQNLAGWGRRPAAEILNYQRQLKIREARMELVIEHPGMIRAVPQPKPDRSPFSIPVYATSRGAKDALKERARLIAQTRAVYTARKGT